MIRMRNRIIHGYDRVDHQTVWDTVTHDLPALVRKLTAILPEEHQEGGDSLGA
jgi:uncharacterized protein with HEPN domain